MSTRASVWILNKQNGDERILYHHCDGYMLDEELNPVLQNLPDDKWNVNDVAEAIINFDEAYGRHKVDSVGWDSEFVYKIEVGERKMEKFDCGIGNSTRGDQKDKKTQEKYLDKTYTYSKIAIDDEATKAQVIKIQLLEMIKFACKCIENGVCGGDEANKIQRIFKIINEK